jgi:hypothetical protein
MPSRCRFQAVNETAPVLVARYLWTISTTRIVVAYMESLQPIMTPSNEPNEVLLNTAYCIQKNMGRQDRSSKLRRFCWNHLDGCDLGWVALNIGINLDSYQMLRTLE